MRMPNESAASQVLLDPYGTHHAAVLATEPRAAELNTAFAARQSALRSALDARLASEGALSGATALAEAAEAELEDAIRTLESRVLDAVKKKRTADLYAIAFPENLEGALKPQGRAQSAEATRIVNALSAHSSTTDAVRAALPAVTEAAARLLPRVDAVSAAEATNVAAFANELSERRRWREQYRKNFGVLTALFPLDPRKVDRFFYEQRPAAKKKPEPAK